MSRDDSPRQQAVELILMRRLASHLATPIFIVDGEGHLLYCNPAAEPLLGRNAEGTGNSSREELYSAFRPRDAAGVLLEPGEHPLTIARRERQPAHRRYWIRGLDGAERQIESTAIPLIGPSGRMLGAVGIFWEIDSP